MGDSPVINFTATVSSAAHDDEPRYVHGRMTVHNWHPTDHRYCLYLPYEDPAFGEDHGSSRRLALLATKVGSLGFGGGHQQVSGVALAAPGVPAHVVPLAITGAAAAAGDVDLAFSATVPRLLSSDPASWFYDGYLPELLGSCPPAGLDPSYYRRPLAAAITGSLTLPAGWEYAGPGERRPDGRVDVALTSRTVAFALGRGYQQRRFKAGDVPVTLLFHSDSFPDLAGTVTETMASLTRFFGPYPYKTLTIVETPELARHGLPGLIAMNRPKQMLFDQAQKAWLNWQHWIFAIQLAHQWYGGAITAATPDDDWLVDGIAEFATLETLSRNQQRFNLFNPAGPRFLSFDYLQISELIAATLRSAAPFAVLTNPDLSSRDPAPKQHPLLFIKQAFALRQLKSYAGDAPFFGFLRNVTARHLHGFLTPRDFSTALGQLPSPFPPTVRQDLAAFLARWWANEGWPDFALTDFASQPLPDGRWVSHVTVNQEGGIDFPPLVGVQDDAGKTVLVRATRRSGDAPGWSATAVTAYKPREATVDPTHETYDADRFNNSSAVRGLTVFPFGTDTLHDDAETLVFYPYAFRHPGEPYAIGIQAALFHYIQSGLLAKVEISPSTRQAAFDASDSFSLPSYALTGSVSVAGDIYNDRQAQAVLKRSPVVVADPNLSLALGVRHKAQVGMPETEHSTGVVFAELAPVGVRRNCSYALALQHEKAPKQLARGGFEYDRTLGTADFGCYLTVRSRLSLRLFRGEVAGDGTLPQAALFNPTDLGEARLKLDRGVGWVSALDSAGADLLLPFYLPLPVDSLILARQMRWRLFYDVGRSVGPSLTYRDAGVGLQMPLGGDLSGAGSLAFTRFSLLTVLYTDVDGAVSRKPAFLFDFSGKL